MEKKAKFIGACKKNPFDRHAWQWTDLCYEYRGHKYIITKYNNGYMGESLAEQHRKEQANIDRMIEEANQPKPEWKYEGSADQAFDEFVKEMGWV